MSDRGRLFVLSAPSGSGKSAVEELLFRLCPRLVYSVSYTTRAPRPGELDGENYNFIDEVAFQAMIEADSFLEWAEVFGRRYGTGRLWVESRLERGLDVLADLDVAGARSVKDKMPEATLIFMVPPSREELERRLRARATESEEQLALRLGRAGEEIENRGLYDYLLINDDLQRAAQELAGIIEGRPGRPMAEAEDFWPVFFASGAQRA